LHKHRKSRVASSGILAAAAAATTVALVPSGAQAATTTASHATTSHVSAAAFQAAAYVAKHATITPVGVATGTPVDQATAAPTYTVRSGDTLYAISARTLGNGTRYNEIFALNKGKTESDGSVFTNPDLIQPGWTLALPGGATAPTTGSSSTPATPSDSSTTSSSGSSSTSSATSTGTSSGTSYAASVSTSALTPTGVDGSQSYFSLDSSQLANARTIVQVAYQRGLPEYAAVIAVATAIQESTLQNLTVAVDHDSLGLFQQRPSMGWGTASEITDPAYAAGAFYNALVSQDPNYLNQPLYEAAQTVQQSGYPYAYAQWESLAAQIVQEVTN
jgi:LysM repeat protein